MPNVTLVLEGEKPNSMNIFYGGKATGWKRQQLAETAHQLIALAVREYEATHGPIYLGFPVAITYTVYFKDERRRDCDNVAVKLYQDGLVRCQLLPDDSSKWVPDISIRIRRDHERPRVEIAIEEI